MALVELLDKLKTKRYVIDILDSKHVHHFYYGESEFDTEDIQKLFNKQVKSINLAKMSSLPPESEPLITIELDGILDIEVEEKVLKEVLK